MKKNGLYFGLLLCILAGCALQKKVSRSESLQHQEIIARCADLPDTPFQTHLEQIAVSSKGNDELQLFYTFAMPAQDLISFYHQQMERLGWDLFAQSDAQDCLLHYVKPRQVCSILISEHHHLSIYICNKKGA